ncbi:MAG: glycosyltransferase family 2 protein, partial [Bacteroidales bacterium]|nr:glycosyltransferase family 2 protein [Bacteroidales bacterium]
SIDIVVSVYNEEEGLRAFVEKTKEVLQNLNLRSCILLVNDGSSDNSVHIINELAKNSPVVKAIHLSRNFGHEAAMLAGIDHSNADALICLDADMQHPPDEIPAMVKKINEGFDIINMVRNDRDDGGFFRKITSALFYSIINRISPVKLEKNASDFFIISRKVIRILQKEYRERTRFLRGYTQIVGFRKTTLSYYADNRYAGKSKYSLSKLLILTTGAIVSFSKVPLYMGLVLGLLSAIMAIGVLVYSIVIKISGGAPPGYTTLIVFMSFMFAIQFFLIGILGLYIGYIFDENKKRPIYIVDNCIGFDNDKV